jgi:phage-related holin
MNTPSHSIRIAKAIMVFKISNEGLSIIAACAQVGISRSSFYYLTQVATIDEKVEKSIGLV